MLRQRPPILYPAGALLFAFLYLCASALSLTWLILLFMGLCFACGAFWYKDIQNTLFLGFIFTSSIAITKAIVASGGIYTAGLSLTLSDLFLLPLLFLWIIDRTIIRRQAIYWSRLHLLPLLFLLWLWFTAAIAEDKSAALFMCLDYSKYTLIFVMLADYIRTPRHFRLVLLGLAAALCVHTAMALLELLAGNIINLQGTKTTPTGTSLVFDQAGGLHAFRPSGFMGHPNALSDLMVFLLPPMLLLLLLGKRYIGRSPWLAIAALFGLAVVLLLLTLSRAGWIACAAAFLFVLVLGYGRGIVRKRHIHFLVLLGAVGLTCAVLLFPAVYLRITESDQRSGESRMAMMHQAALIIQRNPVAGVGVGGYNRAAHANIPEQFAYLSPYFQEELLKGVVHNKYLLVTSETGFVGLSLFVLMLGRFVLAVPREARWSDPVLFALALGITGGIVGQVVFYLFDHFYTDARIVLCYLYFGLLAALLKIREQEWRRNAAAELVADEQG